MSLLHGHVPRDAFAELSCFRTEFYACLTGRSDALFELADALLCADGPVRTLAELSLAPEHRRGHGALCGGLNRGRLDVARLRMALVGLPLPGRRRAGWFWRSMSATGCARMRIPARTGCSATHTVGAGARPR
jgi:hypothetical protein